MQTQVRSIINVHPALSGYIRRGKDILGPFTRDHDGNGCESSPSLCVEEVERRCVCGVEIC